MQTHTIPSIKKTIRSGFLDPSAPPAATAHTGDVVGFPITWTQRGNEAKFGMSFAEREPPRHQCPHGPKRFSPREFAPLKVFVADLNLFVYPCCGRARAASICILP